MGIVKTSGGPQRRKPRKNAITAAKRRRWLDVLADTCNVTAACAATGLNTGTMYGLRHKDGEFARLWAEALVTGTERLEEKLLAHAMGQEPTGDNPDSFRDVSAVAVPFDPKLALDVLKHRQSQKVNGRRSRPTWPSQIEVDAMLMERLEELSQRLAKEGDVGPGREA